MRSLRLILLLSTSILFAREVSVMTYNAENLFDTVHDEGKNDWAYLPLWYKKQDPRVYEACSEVRNPFYRDQCFNLDWNEEVLNTKIRNLSQVIKAYNNGAGPDIIVLQEVENRRVVEMLRDRGLKGMGYSNIVHVEGPDRRGIDVAMISRYPLKHEPILHKVELWVEDDEGFLRKKTTRGILEATFQILSRKQLTVLGNHWPSQAGPDEQRDIAAQVLRKVAKQQRGKAVIATGDFNTLETDNPHGINNWITNPSLPIHFYDYFEVGGHGPWDLLSPGTHWYRGDWSYLDRFFILNTYDDYLDPMFNSLEILVKQWMVEDIEWSEWGSDKSKIARNVPIRFNPETGEGYSDHLPVVIKLNF